MRQSIKEERLLHLANRILHNSYAESIQMDHTELMNEVKAFKGENYEHFSYRSKGKASAFD